MVVRERSAFRAAWTLDKAVTEYEPLGKAAEEILALKRWVLERLKLCTSEAVKNRKAAHG
jgi:cellulose biosynthesis protein BcsQ